MQVELQAHIAFHLTGRLPQGEGDALAHSDLQPAIFAGYRDLTALRYDFPLVLLGGQRRTTGAVAVRLVRWRGEGNRRERRRRTHAKTRRPARAGDPQAGRGRHDRDFIGALRSRGRAHRRQERRVAGEERRRSARRAEGRRRGHRLRQGDAVPAVPACLAGFAGSEGAEIPRPDQQADHETVRHPECGFRPLERRYQPGTAVRASV